MIRVFDGHNDALLRLHRAGGEIEPFLDGVDEDAHGDSARARSGGFAGGLFAAFVPSGPKLSEPPPGTTTYAVPFAPPVDPAVALTTTDQLAAILFGLEGAGALRVVKSA